MTEQEEVEAELMADFDRRFNVAHPDEPVARLCPICGKRIPADWLHIYGRPGFCTVVRSDR